MKNNIQDLVAFFKNPEKRPVYPTVPTLEELQTAEYPSLWGRHSSIVGYSCIVDGPYILRMVYPDGSQFFYSEDTDKWEPSSWTFIDLLTIYENRGHIEFLGWIK
jgi:hypothetical protein